MNRTELLARANEIITKDRAATHGDAENSFLQIANLWTDYLSYPIDTKDVAVMMVLFKIARAKGNPSHEDNWVDMLGYAAIGGEIAASAPKESGEVLNFVEKLESCKPRPMSFYAVNTVQGLAQTGEGNWHNVSDGVARVLEARFSENVKIVTLYLEKDAFGTLHFPEEYSKQETKQEAANGSNQHS